MPRMVRSMVGNMQVMGSSREQHLVRPANLMAFRSMPFITASLSVSVVDANTVAACIGPAGRSKPMRRDSASPSRADGLWTVQGYSPHFSRSASSASVMMADVSCPYLHRDAFPVASHTWANA